MKPYFETELGKLYHGDAYSVMSGFNITPDHILLTDPMYGHNPNIKGSKTKRGRARILKNMNMKNKDWPDLPLAEAFNPKNKPWFDFKQIILWGANHYADKLPSSAKWIIWDKRLDVRPDDNADAEMAWTNLKGVTRVHRQLWKGCCRSGSENLSINGSKLHPFQKPISLMSFCLNQFKISDETIIYDPFTGSGTIPVLCEQRQLKWVAIDMEEWCCEVAAKRIEQESKQLKMF